MHQLQNELKKHGHAVPEQEDMNDEEYEALLKQQIETKIPLVDLSAYRNIWDFICSALAECQYPCPHKYYILFNVLLIWVWWKATSSFFVRDYCCDYSYQQLSLCFWLFIMFMQFLIQK